MELVFESGNVTIEDSVIEKIIGNALREVEGIVTTVPKTIKSGVADFIGIEDFGKGIEVVNEDNKIGVKVHLVIEYGKNVVDLSEDVQNKVFQAVKDMVNVVPNYVNVTIEDVKDVKTNKKTETNK